MSALSLAARVTIPITATLGALKIHACDGTLRLDRTSHLLANCCGFVAGLNLGTVFAAFGRPGSWPSTILV